jgi:hypothetical protein
VFTIYPKKGEPFNLEFEKFDFDGKTFTLYESRVGSDPAPFVRGSHLTVKHVAAIIPATAKNRIPGEQRFRVYLKNRTDLIEVHACYFEPEGQTNVVFYWEKVVHGNLKKTEIENIYIAWSEVVAIVPFVVPSEDSAAS